MRFENFHFRTSTNLSKRVYENLLRKIVNNYFIYMHIYIYCFTVIELDY